MRSGAASAGAGGGRSERVWLRRSCPGDLFSRFGPGDLFWQFGSGYLVQAKRSLICIKLRVVLIISVLVWILRFLLP